MRKVNFNIMIISSFFVLLLALPGCGSTAEEQIGPRSSGNIKTVQPQESPTPSGEETLKTFTKEELKKYDGKNGSPAYIAVNGKVYDVTNAPRWNTGMHNGVTAGNDLTEEMKNSPHGLSKLELLKVVGELK
jgi:predicted heme/steroid binding protein